MILYPGSNLQTFLPLPFCEDFHSRLNSGPGPILGIALAAVLRYRRWLSRGLLTEEALVMEIDRRHFQLCLSTNLAPALPVNPTPFACALKLLVFWMLAVVVRQLELQGLHHQLLRPKNTLRFNESLFGNVIKRVSTFDAISTEKHR